MRLGRALILLTVLTSTAQAADLSIAVSSAPFSIDPHYYNAVTDKALAVHLFDRLVDVSVDVKPVPALATGWKTSSDTVWEFTLRPGVVWQDGVPFSPDDVVFSLARAPRVPNSPGGFGPMLRAVRQVEVTGPLSLRITTEKATPNLPIDLSNIAIVSRHAGETATTADYNSGRAAIGTGPYRMTRFAIGDRVELTRNEGWWGVKPEWEHVSYRFITDNAARTAALLSGDVELIDAPSLDTLAQLRQDPKVQVFDTFGVRTYYLYPDFAHAGESPFVTDAAGQKLPHNPLLDVRVRQALSMAINQAAIADRVLQGTGVPTGQWMWPGAYSYAPDVAPPVYDPARARALLAEAGYPQGFHIALHEPGDTGTNSVIAQAVAQMWTRVGVATEVVNLPSSVFYGRANRHEFSIAQESWGSVSGEAGYLLTNVLGTQDAALGRGPFNAGGYSNPALDALTDQALATLDGGVREGLLIRAVRLASEDVAIIPLYQLKNLWAARRGIVYEARPDQRTLAMSAHLVAK